MLLDQMFLDESVLDEMLLSLFGLDQQVKPVQPNTSFTDPWSTETLCSTLCIKEKENNIRAEEAAQNPETN